MAIRVIRDGGITFESPKVKRQSESTPRRTHAMAKFLRAPFARMSGANKMTGKSAGQIKIALHKAVIAREGEDSRQHELRKRRNARIECAKAKREKGIRQEVGKLHWPKPVVKLDRREQSDVRQHPGQKHAHSCYR